MRTKLAQTSENEIWICGAGIVSALGKDLETLGTALESGATGIKPVADFNTEVFSTSLGAQIDSFKANAYVKQRKNLKLMSRSVRLGMAAIRLACDSADGLVEDALPERRGVVVGAGIALGQSRDLVAGIRQSFVDGRFDSAQFGEVGMRAINPLWLLKGLSNNVLGFATAEIDARGFNQNYCNSGISGLQAISEACWALRENRADILIAGGSDATVDPFHFAGFSRLRALSSAKEAHQIRPFDDRRDGFVLGEGAAYFVLQRAEDAKRNGKKGLARVLGSSTMTCPNKPLESDPGILAQCLRRCIETADVPLDSVGAIIAHGNGSRRFDQVEAEAINLVFGSNGPPVTTNKAQLGHTIAASGPLSVAAALYAGRVGRLPAVPNASQFDEFSGEINLVHTKACSLNTSRILVITAGLGGQLSCLLMEVF